MVDSLRINLDKALLPMLAAPFPFIGRIIAYPAWKKQTPHAGARQIPAEGGVYKWTA